MKFEHELKLHTAYFHRVQSGQKTFEVRRNDRDYQVGDVLQLREFDPARGEYIDYSTPIYAEITYTTTYEQKDGFIVLGIKVKDQADGK